MALFLHRNQDIGAKKTELPEPLKANVFHSSPAVAFGALALGAFAIGAFAIGTLAIGKLLVGKVSVGSARIKKLEIDELIVGRTDAGAISSSETDRSGGTGQDEQKQ